MNYPIPYNFCPRCGNPLSDTLILGASRRHCPACGFTHFVDPKVAVLVLIENDGKVLLIKRKFQPAKGSWSLPSGFVDYGEDPVDAAVREVKEETNLEITITRLVDVFSPRESGGIHPTILMLYMGKIVSGRLSPQDDAAEAILFLPDQIPYDQLAFKNTGQILRDWIASPDP